MLIERANIERWAGAADGRDAQPDLKCIVVHSRRAGLRWPVTGTAADVDASVADELFSHLGGRGVSSLRGADRRRHCSSGYERLPPDLLRSRLSGRRSLGVG